jgi:hypothetical protein
MYYIPTIIYRDIIYALYPSSTPPPQTTAIFRNFKKSTATGKVHNMGLRYINTVLSPTVKSCHNKSCYSADMHIQFAISPYDFTVNFCARDTTAIFIRRKCIENL